ncbi:MAG: (d)CMP kinase [Phycisphaerales bacterium]|nr:(d)CMP kinase [Phycisphaerales bacterium]
MDKNKEKLIVTIDGPAGSGKSTAALLLAERLGIPHLDTGAMYRAVALDALEQGIQDDPTRIAQRCRQLVLDFDWTKTPADILLNGRNVAAAIRQPQVTEMTYVAADNPLVRQELATLQRLIAQKAGSLVTEGRDQGTVVFPHANFKFYLTANPEERARRRIAQLTPQKGGGGEREGGGAELQNVLQQILQRDQRDQARAVGPLARPHDAIELDTTHLTIEQTVDAMIQHIQNNR